MMKKIRIGNRWIGDSEPLYFVADIGANHDGDLDRAYQLIETAKEAGADAAKFQNFQADTIVSKEGFESLGDKLSHQKSWKKSVYEVYENASLPYEWIPQAEKTGEIPVPRLDNAKFRIGEFSGKKNRATTTMKLGGKLNPTLQLCVIPERTD